MNRATKATALSALSLLALAALPGCGGDSGSDGDPTAGKPEAATSGAAQPSPAERLAKTMVTEPEVGGLKVEKTDEKFLFAQSPDEVTTDKPGCAPLALAVLFVAAGRSAWLGRWVRFQTVELPRGALA
ncbi:hypothetical protein [Streptomyces parvulus]|uniref:hypothetical protein n=1 Tax=Streptomyces parvulus TaxID=146923 RepID=UPI0033EE9AE1